MPVSSTHSYTETQAEMVGGVSAAKTTLQAYTVKYVSPTTIETHELSDASRAAVTLLVIHWPH